MKCTIKWTEGECENYGNNNKPCCGEEDRCKEYYCYKRLVHKAYCGEIQKYEIEEDAIGDAVYIQINKRRKIDATIDHYGNCKYILNELEYLEIDGKVIFDEEKYGCILNFDGFKDE